MGVTQCWPWSGAQLYLDKAFLIVLGFSTFPRSGRVEATGRSSRVKDVKICVLSLISAMTFAYVGYIIKLVGGTRHGSGQF